MAGTKWHIAKWFMNCGFFGLSRLDYFAGQALAGFLANPDHVIDGAQTPQATMTQIAEASYGFARAMIEARDDGRQATGPQLKPHASMNSAPPSQR